MRFLTKEEVLELHADAIAKFGGEYGIRDDGLLESAITAPENRFCYEPETDIAALAATYAYHINKNHAFIDGNKRTAAAASEVFLNLNNVQLTASDDELIDLHLNIEANKLSREDVENSLRSWIIVAPILSQNEQLTLKFQEDLKTKLFELSPIQGLMLQSMRNCSVVSKEANVLLKEAKATKTGLALRAEVARISDSLAKKIHTSISICETNLPTFDKFGKELLEILQEGTISEHFRAEKPDEIRKKTDGMKVLIILIEASKLVLNLTSSMLIGSKQELLGIEIKEPLLSAYQHIIKVVDDLDNSINQLRETLDVMLTQFQQAINSETSELTS